VSFFLSLPMGSCIPTSPKVVIHSIRGDGSFNQRDPSAPRPPPLSSFRTFFSSPRFLGIVFLVSRREETVSRGWSIASCFSLLFRP